MTLDELLHRIENSSVVEVLRTIADDPAEARDFTLTLGPHLIGAFLRADRRKRGLVATTSGRADVPHPRPDWTRHDWRRWADWLGKTYKGFGQTWRFGLRVVEAHGRDERLGFAELRSRLNADDAQRLDRLCGKGLSGTNHGRPVTQSTNVHAVRPFSHD